ncbi:hypothetical protein LVJ94_50245 [Pendulispora rubella]|uniref:Lipoprotein n=1 Tax=Pendulispora rubella TaxID=2741070 RepID=A0ABZ2L285_9BACT
MSSKHIVRVGAFCVVSLVACGGSDGDDGGSGSGTGALPKDGVKEATIHALNTKGGEGPKWGFQAAFIQGRVSSHGEECTTDTVDACTIRLCKEGNLPNPEVPHVYLGAGPITLTGARLPAHEFRAINRVAGNQSSVLPGDPAIYWDGGEDIRVAAGGQPDGVPGFETTLKAPSFVTVTNSIFTEPRFALDTTKDFEVTWTHEGAGSGQTVVRFGQSADVGIKYVSQVASCTFPASSDRGTIPASVLQRLKPFLEASLSITAIEKRTVTAGDWNVEVELGSRTGAGEKPGEYAVNFN